ncbi:MAG: glutathione S-transferase family protein [Gemmatimonadota bacterium]
MRKLLEFHRSPNCVKVRVALTFKGLDYTTEEMMSADRQPMLDAAGWPMVPILLDGTVAMRDSAAILHYLESNYRDAPSLTPASRNDIRTVEALMGNLNPDVLRIQWAIYPEILKPEGERDGARVAAAGRELSEALARLEERLGGQEWLAGDAMSLYDVILACNLLPARPPARFIADSPLWKFFGKNLALGDDRAHVAAWIDRVASHDGGARPAPAG